MIFLRIVGPIDYLYHPSDSLLMIVGALGLLSAVLLINMLFFDFLEEVFGKQGSVSEKEVFIENIYPISSNPLPLNDSGKNKSNALQTLLALIISFLMIFQSFASLLNPFYWPF